MDKHKWMVSNELESLQAKPLGADRGCRMVLHCYVIGAAKTTRHKKQKCLKKGFRLSERKEGKNLKGILSTSAILIYQKRLYDFKRIYPDFSIDKVRPPFFLMETIFKTLRDLFLRMVVCRAFQFIPGRYFTALYCKTVLKC